MRQISFLMMVVMLSICCLTVSAATYYWSQEGNIGNRLSAGTGKGSYTSYLPNNDGNTSYVSCSIATGALFEPVSYDYTNQGVMNYVVLSQTTGIHIYDMNCNYILQVTGLVPDMMPTLTNIDRDADLEITFVTNNTIYVLEYNHINAVYDLMISYNLPFGPDVFACARTTTSLDTTLDGKCMIANVTINSTANGVYLTKFMSIDFSGGAYLNPVIQATNLTTTAPASSSYVIDLSITAMSDSTVYPSTIGYGLFPVCLKQQGTSNLLKIRCDIFRSDAVLYSSFDINASVATAGGSLLGTRLQGVNYYHAGIVNVNNNELLDFAIAVKGTSSAAYRYSFHRITSLSGATILTGNDVETANGFAASNIMVGNLDKGVNNQLCLAVYSTASNINLNCYDSAGSLVYRYNISNSSYRYNNFDFVMGDFAAANRLCLGSRTGIQCIDTAANRSYTLYNSTLGLETISTYDGTKNADAANGRSIIVSMPALAKPVLIYAQPDVVYIFSGGTTGVVCGDGYCDPNFENAFTCPADCDVNSTCLTTDPSYICRSSCSSSYQEVAGLSCIGVDPAFKCCAPSTSLGCSLSNPSACTQLNSTCTDYNNTHGRFLCNSPFLINSTVFCSLAVYDCVANGFSGCTNGACSNVLCRTDTDCFDGFPTCLDGTCVSGFTGRYCTDSSDCPVNQSICYENSCISGYSGVLSNTTISAQSEYRQDLTYWTDYLFAGSSFIKMIIAIILIGGALGITFYVMALWGAPNIIIPVIFGFMTMILCTAFGLIPIWFIMILILGSIALFLLFKQMLQPGST